MSFTVYHPRLPGVVRTGLSDAQRESHKASGWRMSPLPTREGAEPADPEQSGSPAVIDTTADELG